MKTKTLRFARWAGILPLVAGVGTTLLWMATGHEGLVGLGLLMIPLGVVCVLGGMVALWCYLASSWKNPAMDRGRALRQVLWVLLLYAGNFVAAAGCFLAAEMWLGRQCVVIVNESPAVVRSLVIRGSGVKIELGDLPPGEQTSRTFWVNQDGNLVLDAVTDHGPVQVEVTDYTAGLMGEKYNVTLQPDGTWDVK